MANISPVEFDASLGDTSIALTDGKGSAHGAKADTKWIRSGTRSRCSIKFSLLIVSEGSMAERLWELSCL